MKSGNRGLGKLAREVHAPFLRDLKVLFDEVLCAGRSHTEDDFRLENRDLGFEPLTAGLNFLIGGRAVNRLSGSPIGGPALDRVGDINLSSQKSCFADRLVQQLPGSTDKRATQFVFRIARSFPNED